MQEEYYPKYYDTLRFFLGDIRDYDRLCDAFRGVDVLFHAAALKQVLSHGLTPILGERDYLSKGRWEKDSDGTKGR